MTRIDSKKLDYNSEVVNVKNLFKGNIQENNNMLKYRSINVMNLQNENELSNFNNTISPLSLDTINNNEVQTNSNPPITNNNETGKNSLTLDVTSNHTNNNSNNARNDSNIESNSRDNNSNFTGIFNPILDILSNNSRSNHSNDNNNDNFQMNEECLICFDKLTPEESNNNFIGCPHGFCNECFLNYFKEKINSKIDEIKCPEKDCKTMIPNYFIEEKLINDIPLLSKYKKLKKIRQLELDPNVEFCPYPNCESYAIKKDTNFVSCIHNGHKFCFNCRNYWHDKGRCNIDIYSYYKKWKTSSKIKRCPRCKYLIEKNEGCNHMTCLNCKYEWCWICSKEYKPGHYGLGSQCYGLQYSSSRCCPDNRCCTLLRQIGNFLLNYIAKPLLILLLYPLFVFISLQMIIFDKFIIIKKKVEIFYILSALVQYIRLAIYVYYFFICGLITMIIVCPLRRKILYFLKSL